MHIYAKETKRARSWTLQAHKLYTYRRYCCNLKRLIQQEKNINSAIYRDNSLFSKKYIDELNIWPILRKKKKNNAEYPAVIYEHL